jgi:RNA polymerase sigma factor (sigma-70 family)
MIAGPRDSRQIRSIVAPRNAWEPPGSLRCRQGQDQGDGDRISADRQDTEILARVRGGDRDAYAELVRRHAPVAVRTASLLGAGPDAEDVVQEAFVKAYAALGRFRDGAAFRPWLLQIVANETRNLHRAAGRRAARERSAWERTEPLLAGVDDPATSVLARERRAQLVRGLSHLSESHRQVLTCRYLLDLDEIETATVLGWPRGTVKSRLHRALRQLSEAMARPSIAAARAYEPHAREADHGA